MRHLFLATTALIGCMTASAACAQSSASGAPATSGAQAPDSGLGDIIVTAQRRTESAQRAAVAINVVSGDDLIKSGVSASNTLSSVVPALTVESVGPSTAFFVRGVGNFSVSVTSDPAIAFNYDGVYVGRHTATTTTFFDLDRVEVLKGPQGTLYGRNATAGAVNVLPTQPKPGEFSGYATASYGNYNAFTAEGAINVPLGEDGAARLSGSINRRDGYYADGTSDDKSEALRFQMKAKLTPTLTARVAADYAHLGGAGMGLTYFNTYACNATTLACTITPTGLSRSDGSLSPASQAFWQARPTRVAGRLNDPFPAIWQNSRYFGASADVTWDTGAGVLTVIPAVRTDHILNLNPAGGFAIANDQKDYQSSIEARFAGKAGLFDYTLGFYYFNESARLKNGSVTGGSTAGSGTTNNVDTQSYAPFARLTANLSPRLRLVGGIRYTHDAKQFTANAVSLSEACTVASCANAILPIATPYISAQPFAVPTTIATSVPGSTPGVVVNTYATIPGPTAGTILNRTDISFSNALSSGHATYRGAVEFDVAPASLLYASVESGYRSGGFSTSVGYETFQPEYITAYTIGSKNRFLNNRVQLNLEAFYWKYTNQQVAHAGFDLLNRAGNFTQNIGSSTIKGVEFEGRFLVTPTTRLSADVQYLDAHNDSFVFQQSKILGLPRTDCAVSTSTTNAALYDVNCAGLPGYNSPKWTINLAAEQTVPLGEYRLVMGVDTQFKTSRYTYFDYQPEQVQPANWTTNAQISFGPSSGRWSVAGYVRNIENKRLLVAPVAFLGLLAGYTSAPRTYGLRVSAKF